MIIAMPSWDGKLVSHFGHARQFAFVTVSDTKEIEKVDYKESPVHQPGVLPRWLEEQGADVIIAGGMGRKAMVLFESFGLEVRNGVKEDSVENLVKAYLNDSLEASGELCGQHEHHHGHGEGHGHGNGNCNH